MAATAALWRSRDAAAPDVLNSNHAAACTVPCTVCMAAVWAGGSSRLGVVGTRTCRREV